MKITFDLDQNDVVLLLSMAAAGDEDLLEQRLSKTQLKAICKRTVEDHGLSLDGWSDGLTDVQAGIVSGWAYKQMSRYKI